MMQLDRISIHEQRIAPARADDSETESVKAIPCTRRKPDKPLWLLILKRFEVRLALWLEYRFWPWTWEMFRDQSAISRRLAVAGWVTGILGVLYVLGHLLVAGKRGFLLP